MMMKMVVEMVVVTWTVVCSEIFSWHQILSWITEVEAHFNDNNNKCART